MSSLSKDETCRNSSLALTISYYTVIKTIFYVFLCMVLLAVRMVADVTETCNVIPSVLNLYSRIPCYSELAIPYSTPTKSDKTQNL